MGRVPLVDLGISTAESCHRILMPEASYAAAVIGQRQSFATGCCGAIRTRQDLAAGACACAGDPVSVSLRSPLLTHRNTLVSSSTTRKAAGSHLRSYSKARQRLLRCRQMTNNPPQVQASGGLVVSALESGQCLQLFSATEAWQDSGVVGRPISRLTAGGGMKTLLLTRAWLAPTHAGSLNVRAGSR